MHKLTLEEQACNSQTMRHIERVRNFLNKMVVEILKRGELHDQSKLEPPEVELFTKMTPLLESLTFGSQEYDSAKKELGVALEHHYANNRHHPEYHENGIEDMNLVDLVEMVCDWLAASTRHADGDIRRSLKINEERYNIPPALIKIFENTLPLLEN